LSQTRVRLRALASLGLSIILFGALTPPASAFASATTAPVARASAAPVAPTSVDLNAEWTWSSVPSASRPIQRIVLDNALIAVPSSAVPAGRTRPARPSPAHRPARPARKLVRTAPSSRLTAGLASSRIIALAESHIGARYAHGATGPSAFDCSGLVYRVFEDAGLGRMIAGLRSASALYAHFRARHMTSSSAPQLGDLVIFGNGSHVGIYIGGGRVVHAMVTGVAITRISAVYPHFTTYIHLGLSTLHLTAR
jgi:cell wall-associated NlpC family hydrolase